MLKLLTKTMPWMVASLLVATSGFGQNDRCCPRPKPCCPEPKPCCPTVCPIQLIPAYNHPARIDVRCPWDVDVFASFIYWQAIEENLELGIVNTTPLASFFAGAAGLQGSVVEMDFKYKPGFKVGAGFGFDYDDWDVQAQYTWFRSHTHTSTEATVGGANILEMWGHPVEVLGNGYNFASGHWKLRMDLVDLNLGRWYYVGKMLTFRPYFGGRAAWIRQSYAANFVNEGLGGVGGFTTNQSINQKSTSWAVGTEAGLDTNWIMGQGFRLYGNGMMDILFTRYNKASFAEAISGVGFAVGYSDNISERKVNTLRTHLDLELGLGWGTYIDCNNWYLDFSAGYGFQVFFDQNMFRHFEDDFSFGASRNPNGNLYIHGLTATVRLDF